MASLRAAVLLGFVGTVLPVAVHGQAAANEQEPRYDGATVINAIATVVEVREVARTKPLAGVHLQLKTDRESIDSYLAPVEFVKDCGGSYTKGDRVQVWASRVKWGEAFVLLVREIRKDTSTVYLRDERGNPNWAPEKGKS